MLFRDKWLTFSWHGVRTIASAASVNPGNGVRTNFVCSLRPGKCFNA